MAAPPPDPALDALRRDILGGMAALEERLRQHIDQRLTQTQESMDQRFTQTHEYIDQRLTETTAETRRYFGVVAESLMGKIELVAEGVRASGERLERFEGEVRGQFAQVDRRLLRLRARLPRRPRP